MIGESINKWVNQVRADEPQHCGWHNKNAKDGLDFVGFKVWEDVFLTVGKINCKSGEDKNWETSFEDRLKIGERQFVFAIITFTVVGKVVKEKEDKINDDEREDSQRETSSQVICDKEGEKTKNGFEAKGNTSLVEFAFFLNSAIETIADGFNDAETRQEQYNADFKDRKMVDQTKNKQE